ncbi:minor tail protein [Streptomyces phage TG1]|uniref:Minor tail protein n=1 Tax=Streptomyces phage TG1 TaxID=2927987 RepID=K4I324_9CAUD|nr:minor tail protein [Streptomyces phage TG1]AFU62210.1 minor tail protein [Streptomyces phage TG1]
MPNFEVIQVEAVTGRVIATLPVTGITYGDTLNAAGSASVGVPLDGVDPDTLGPGRSALVVLRDGEPDWGGIVWTMSADLAGNVLTLNASGWHSYYGSRYLAMTNGYSGKKDQALLLRDWVEWCNDNGGIDTDTSRITTTGRIRARKWDFAEFKNVAQAVEELADEDGGFDFRYETYWRDSKRTRIGNRFLKEGRATLTFPTLTHRVDADVTQVAYDGSKMATDAWTFGADLGTGVKPYAAIPTGLDGTPTLAQVTTYSDLKSSGELLPKAGALAAMSRQAIAVPTLTLYPGVYDPAKFQVGAFGTVNVDSGFVRLLEEFVITERRVAVDVNGTEVVTLSLASKEVFENGDSS